MDGVQHFEITADDTERAKEFYRKVFGWDFVDLPEMNYIMVRTGKTNEKGMIQEMGVINGGMMKRGEEIKSPVITIVVDDVEKKMRDVEGNGGKIVMGKMKVGEIGFSAYVRDSEDNVIGLFQPTRMI